MKHIGRRKALASVVTAAALSVLIPLLPPAAGAPWPAAAPGPGHARVELPDDPALRGSWELDRATAAVVWRSPRALPVLGAHPVLAVGGEVVAVPRTTADGRGLTVPLAALRGVDTERLEVWLGPDRLDRSGAGSTLRSGAGSTLRSDTASAPRAFDDPAVLDLDPAGPGPHETETFDYRAAPLPTTELVAAMEVRGHVVLPRGVDDAPLVLFLHGRHGACYRTDGDRVRLRGDEQPAWRCPAGTRPIPSLMGYEYLQELLASQGFATVSVAANAVNAMDGDTPDFGATARAALVHHHLTLIGGWVGDPANEQWSGRVDLDNTVLVGHSRGGEGVARAAIDTVDSSPWDVTGLVLLAPTAPVRLATPHTPSVTLLPYCDGDVVDLTGGQFTDLPRDLDITDPALHATVLVRGANHNYFNTQWTPGLAAAPTIDDARRTRHPGCAADAPGRLSAAQQRGTAEAWVAAAVQLFALDDQSVLPMFDSAGPVTVASAPYASVLTNAVGGRTMVRPVLDAALTGAARSCFAALHGKGDARLCGRGVEGFAPRAPHWVYERFRGAPVQQQLELGWQEAGVTGGMTLDEPVDVSGARLDLRVIVDPVLHPRRATRFAVVLEDADGHRWSTSTALHPLGPDVLSTYAAQVVGIDPTQAPVGFDVTSVRTVEIVAESSTGRLWLLDAAVRRATLPEVDDDRRLPVLTLQPRTPVVEGDRPRGTATVRWSLDEPAPVEAHAVVVVLAYGRPRTQTPVRFTVPAGVTRGTVEVPYPADDEPGTTYTTLIPFPVDGVLVTRPFAGLGIKDDD